MFFYPLYFVGKIIISFGLIFPRINILFFVISNILLSSIKAFMRNAKIATMLDAGVSYIPHFDGENAC